MAVDTLPAQRTEDRLEVVLGRRRSARENLAPAMLGLLVYLLAFAFILAWPLLQPGLVRATFGAAVTVALAVGLYVAATAGDDR